MRSQRAALLTPTFSVSMIISCAICLSHRPFCDVTVTTNKLNVFKAIQFVCHWRLFLLYVKDQSTDQLLLPLSLHRLPDEPLTKAVCHQARHIHHNQNKTCSRCNNKNPRTHAYATLPNATNTFRYSSPQNPVYNQNTLLYARR
jgi:hypothetical protein